MRKDHRGRGEGGHFGIIIDAAVGAEDGDDEDVGDGEGDDDEDVGDDGNG